MKFDVTVHAFEFDSDWTSGFLFNTKGINVYLFGALWAHTNDMLESVVLISVSLCVNTAWKS
jgi:hypothetical protein